MQLDIPFFLGILYTVMGTMVLGGWFWTHEVWNLYGGLMLAIGLVLVWLRPKPPLRFFLGRIEPAERQQPEDEHMDMM